MAAPRSTRPDPTPVGLVPTWSCGDYDGLLRAMVLGHKEHRMLGLRRPLGDLLARAVGAAVPTGPVVLVPVPSRPGSTRVRGHDPLRGMVAEAVVTLTRTRWAVAWPGLRAGRGLADQAGLTAEQRWVNLAGSMSCPAAGVRRLVARARTAPDARIQVVVCDDVLTTGATAREAQRALTDVGVPVTAVATVAATVRRASLLHGHR